MSIDQGKHWYVPSTLHMGDCDICGHLQEHHNHWKSLPSTPESKDLRDLVRQIEEVARNHMAFSMVYSVVQNCCDHISARARNIELETQQRNMGGPSV
jgi:hypothetical protein